VREQVGALPFILCLNKADLRDQWEIDLNVVQSRVRDQGWVVIETSAKLGVGVEEAFTLLTARLIAEKAS
jgi:GTPase SAR1 family protein